MLRFILGLVIGTIIGAVAVLALTVWGGTGILSNNTPSPAPGQAVIRVAVESAYLNQQMNAALAVQSKVQVANAQLILRAPNIAEVNADVAVSVAGVNVKARPTVTMQLAVENGQVKTRLEQIGVGGFDIPVDVIRPQLAEVERILEAQVNRAVASGLAGTGLRISSVSVAGSALIVELAQ